MVEYTVYNVVAVLVGVGFLANGHYLLRREREALALFLTSVAIGSGLILVGVFPNALQVVASLLGLEPEARIVLVASNLTLFVLVSYLLNRVGRLYDRVSRLNEEVSLLKADGEDQRDE